MSAPWLVPPDSTAKCGACGHEERHDQGADADVWFCANDRCECTTERREAFALRELVRELRGAVESFRVHLHGCRNPRQYEYDKVGAALSRAAGMEE